MTADDVVCAPWSDLVSSAPNLARAVRARFRKHERHVLATRTLTGGTRVSGTAVLWDGAEMIVPVPVGAVRAVDLTADPLFELHSNPGERPGAEGDVRVRGRVEPWESHAGPVSGRMFFRLLIEQVTYTPGADGAEQAAVWRAGASAD